MAYADYTYYTDTFRGIKIPSESFNYYSDRASEELDFYVNVTISEILDDYTTEIKKAVCAVADLVYDNANTGIVKSESSLSYSVSYDTSRGKALEKNIYNIISKYLSKTNLLFRGVAG
jgi:hypothetical protein